MSFFVTFVPCCRSSLLDYFVFLYCASLLRQPQTQLSPFCQTCLFLPPLVSHFFTFGFTTLNPEKKWLLYRWYAIWWCAVLILQIHSQSGSTKQILSHISAFQLRFLQREWCFWLKTSVLFPMATNTQNNKVEVYI